MLIPLLLGSRNPARVELTHQAIEGLPVRLVTLDEVGINTEPAENGHTSVENAELKARFYYAATHLPTLAMDGALHIDRFSPEKQPGVRVRRVDGSEPRTDQELHEYYAQELAAIGGQSPARWSAGYALATGEQAVTVEHLEFHVLLVAQAIGAVTPGHALDPLMRDPVTSRPYTQIPPRERPYFKTIRDLVRKVLLP